MATDTQLRAGKLEKVLLEYVRDHPGEPTGHVCNHVSETCGVAWRTARACIDSLTKKRQIKRSEMAQKHGPPFKAVYITKLGQAALTSSFYWVSDWKRSCELQKVFAACPAGPPPWTPPEGPPPMPDPIATAANDALRAVLQEHSQRVHVKRDEVETDPIKWIKVAKPKIESKVPGEGLIYYEPTQFQTAIIRKTVAMERCAIEKSRQIGASTAVEIAAAWMTLFGVPFHGHIVANKAEVAVERILKIAKRALETCTMPDAMRRRLYLGTDNTNVIKFAGRKADNYLRAHAANKDAGHSFDGNWVVLEEFSRMPDAKTIYDGMQGMLDLESTGIMIVSTHDGYGTFFHDLCRESETRGLERIKATWRVHPGRDEAWKQRKIDEMGKDQFDEAHECIPMLLGEAAIDWPKLAEMAQRTLWLGPEYTPGHKYLIGIDQASGGECDTVSCVIDVTARPAQVVELKAFKADSSDDETRTQQKITFMEGVPLAWPAKKVFIDATNERDTAHLVGIKNKVCTHIKDNRGGLTKEQYNEQDRVREMSVPRTTLVDRAITLLERGIVVVHKEHFPKLYEAFESITKGHRYKGVSKKQGGKNMDQFDAFILACQGLTYYVPSEDNVPRIQGIAGEPSWQKLREEKY